jgi:hypothetical protein
MAKRVPQRRTNRSMSGAQLLHKATKSKQWQYLVKNKNTKVFGETDIGRRTITINKKLHAQKSGGHNIKNPNGTESMIGTMVHETIHAAHPRMREKTVRKLAPKRLKKMSQRAKGRLYARFDK